MRMHAESVSASRSLYEGLTDDSRRSLPAKVLFHRDILSASLHYRRNGSRARKDLRRSRLSEASAARRLKGTS
jgi:hypothetical protein